MWATMDRSAKNPGKKDAEHKVEKGHVNSVGAKLEGSR
jgi:hypothetical protein